MSDKANHDGMRFSCFKRRGGSRLYDGLMADGDVK